MASSISATGFRGSFGPLLKSSICGEEYGLFVKSVPKHVRVGKSVRVQPMMKNVIEVKGLFAPIVILTSKIIGKQGYMKLLGIAIAFHIKAITDFCKSTRADEELRQGLLMLARKNGQRIGIVPLTREHDKVL